MTDLHLRVYVDKSELVHPDGRIEIFLEGLTSEEARQRYKTIDAAFTDGYLENQIMLCKNEEATRLGFDQLRNRDIEYFDKLVESVTSEFGRGLLALTIMQLCVKAVEPSQNIRLHKGGENRKDFSWREGISMRSLDNRFITPTLRQYDLIYLNKDGFMMTRTLAENYPYSSVYKARLRGARAEWLQIVGGIEEGDIPPEPGLRYLLSQLINRAEEFQQLAAQTLGTLRQFATASDSDTISAVINTHIQQSDNAARLMEIAMHSLMQVLFELDVFAELELVPLSQMRSANKKHGNIGDVELMRDEQIVEAWDAKYGKAYLRDEIEELSDKLPAHNEVMLVGFVSSEDPERTDEVAPRVSEIEELHGVELRLMSFADWTKVQFHRVFSERIATPDEIARLWLRAYGESLAQLRREIAPIDEPCHKWVETLKYLLERELRTLY